MRSESCAEDGSGGEGQGETAGLLEKVRECLFDFLAITQFNEQEMRQRRTL
jgi:hypothetical protein